MTVMLGPVGCRDGDESPLLVKPAFSTAALAAVPIATGAYARQPDSTCSSHGGSSSSARMRPLTDLLVLQPNGQLVLHRGPAALVTVRLLLPHGHLQQLQDKLAAAAAVRQRAQRQQLQQLEGSPALGPRAGSSRRSSGMQDAEAGTPPGEALMLSCACRFVWSMPLCWACACSRHRWPASDAPSQNGDRLTHSHC